jgi:hypothetical protein
VCSAACEPTPPPAPPPACDRSARVVFDLRATGGAYRLFDTTRVKAGEFDISFEVRGCEGFGVAFMTEEDEYSANAYVFVCDFVVRVFIVVVKAVFSCSHYWSAECAYVDV